MAGHITLMEINQVRLFKLSKSPLLHFDWNYLLLVFSWDLSQ